MAVQAEELLPKDEFTKAINYPRWCVIFLGVNCLNANYRTNWRTVVTAGSILGYFFFTFLTIHKTFADNWKFMLEATCMVGSVLQGIAKLGVAHFGHKQIHTLLTIIEKIYADYQCRGPEYKEVLSKDSKQLKHIIMILVVAYIMAALIIIFIPFVLHVLFGSRHLMMHFHLPGLDLSTPFGYFATLGAHSVCMIVGAVGLFAGDGIVVLFFTQAYIFIHILQLLIKELNDMVENADNAKNPAVTKALKDIVKWHSHYTDYAVLNNQIFYWIVTVQVTTAGISIVLTIFVLLTSNWPGGYAYLFITISHLYLYCVLGTKIETCNEQFTYEIYNISWYQMTVAQQKTVRLMLMKSQTPPMMCVADVMPLTVATALQITKTIYSITMMMLQFLVE